MSYEGRRGRGRGKRKGGDGFGRALKGKHRSSGSVARSLFSLSSVAAHDGGDCTVMFLLFHERKHTVVIESDAPLKRCISKITQQKQKYMNENVY